MSKISCIITVYNGGKRGFLPQAIESVLHQTYENFELLIIDDGSTDNTKEICESYLKDSRVTYIYKENGGISSARNCGIKKSTGDYICFLDDDDEWLSDKLEKQIVLFENSQDKKLGMIHTWIQFVDEQSKPFKLQTYTTSGDIYKDLFEKNVINATSSVMIKRGVFDRVGMFKPHMIHWEDYELWFRVAKEYHVESVNEPLVKYRVHSKETLTDSRKRNLLYAHLVYHYALESKRDDVVIDDRKIYNRVHKFFAQSCLGVKDIKEFRRNYKLAKVYGGTGVKLKLLYIASFFPGVVDKLVAWHRKKRALEKKNFER